MLDAGREVEGTYICSTSQHEQADQNNDHVQGEACNPSDTSFCYPSRAIIRFPHSHVGSTPEDEAEERVEK